MNNLSIRGKEISKLSFAAEASKNLLNVESAALSECESAAAAKLSLFSENDENYEKRVSPPKKLELPDRGRIARKRKKRELRSLIKARATLSHSDKKSP